MATPIQLNSFSLQDNSINITRVVFHDQGNEQQLNVLEIARRDGGKLTSSRFRPKTITVEGIIKGTSQSNLETNIDDFKKNIYVTQGNFDVVYAGGSRRYKVATQSVSITREHFHLSFAPFAINFIVLDPPFGLDIASQGATSKTLTEVFSAAPVTDVSSSWDRSYSGTAAPKPIIELILDTVGSIDAISITNTTTNDQLSLNTAWSNGDKIVIDTEDQLVQKNLVDIGYSGIFPEFVVGSNILRIDVNTSANPDQKQETTDGNQAGIQQNVYQAQSFVPSASTTYPRVELLLIKNPGTVDAFNIAVEIWTNSGSSPGSIIAAGATSTITAANVGLSASWVNCQFTTAPSLTAATTYWIVCRHLGAGYTSWDAHIAWKWASGNLYTTGNGAGSNNSGGSWTVETNIDRAFRVYRTTASDWSYDAKVTYTKRYL